MGHLPVLQEGGAKALRSELFGTFPGDRFIQEGGARALRRECFGSLARGPSVLVGPTVWSLPVVCFSRFQR